jgi:hypothetical protein
MARVPHLIASPLANEAETVMGGTPAGLDIFQLLKQKYMKCKELFHHVVQKRLCDPTIKYHDSSPCMDIIFT